MKQLKTISLIIFFTTFNFIYAGYIESEKYGFSFFINETYKKQNIKTPYGLFLQLEHPKSILFVHIWARKKRKGISLPYLKKAYKIDFMKSFIQKKLSKEKIILSNKRTFIVEQKVQFLEQTYLARQIYFSNKKNIYAFIFYFLPKQYKTVKDDIILIMESLVY